MSETSFDPMTLVPRMAQTLSLPPKGIQAVLSLLAEGNTVPFIARYRKEATGTLDEVQIRKIEELRDYLVDLEERRRTVLASIEEQGKLTDALKRKILAAQTKAELEDLYLPYKKKRKTRASVARERGLAPLADMILSQLGQGVPDEAAKAFVQGEVADVQAALAGAKDIVAELVCEKPEVRGAVRSFFVEEGAMVSQKDPKHDGSPTKFEQYYEFSEPVSKMPSHRFLALRRGEREKVLKTKLAVDTERAISQIERRVKVDRRSPYAPLLQDAIQDGYGRLLQPSLENEVRTDTKSRADREAVDVFADNLKNLLLQSPFGGRSVIGIDPGLRTGSKCAAIDGTGKFLETITIYPAKGGAAVSEAKRKLTSFVKKHKPDAIAIGNGTGGRETESFVKAVLKDAGIQGPFVVQVNEAGASVYSASDVARDEFPQLDLTIRGAISIGRRLQDPLAELVKIEPKSIGVGQYQHDVHQPLLSKKLGEVVESCVNNVGVELNTASAPLLSYVAGVSAKVAKNVVAHREKNGPFVSKKQLLKVSGLGPKAFEQCAGFLRVRGGKHPLDASAVHPERYALVEKMAKHVGVALSELVGNAQSVSRIKLQAYVDDEVGMPTLEDIAQELKKPGRDPRDTFAPPAFREDVNTMEDLQEGMRLEGVVTNVTAFGAFVDVGVHQDGLVHISQLSDQFVKEPKDVVKVGQKLKVQVLEVDLARKRISLSARSQPAPSGQRNQRREQPGKPNQGGSGAKGNRNQKGAREFSNNPFAALSKLKKN